MRRLCIGSLGLAVGGGALLALAFPGTGGEGWLAFGALVPLLVAIDGAPWWRASLLGGVAGLSFWLTTASWIAGTLVRYGAVPWLLAGLVALALAVYLSLYWAVFGGVLAAVPSDSGARHVIVAASLWVALEFLRGALFTGFPWNLLGYSQFQVRPVNQIAAVTGVYGVSFVVMAANAGLARALRGPGLWTIRLAALGTSAVIVAAALGYAWLRPSFAATTPEVAVAVIQGDIDQSVKWEREWQERTVVIYRRLTSAAAAQQPRLIVWPETAVPFFLSGDSRTATIAAAARQARAYLLTGAPALREGAPRNSAILFGPDGVARGQYDKRHLVPFGEYVPLKRLLWFVNVLAGGAIGEFVPGTTSGVFSTPVGRLGVFICYEAIFPSDVRDLVRTGADVLVNITNDAWFGRSAAPVQHLAMATFRAIETQRYLIRAANTGISAIVAPDGEIVQASALFAPAVLMGSVKPVVSRTPYVQYGDAFAWGTIVVSALAVLLSIRPRLPKGERRRRYGVIPRAGEPSSGATLRPSAGPDCSVCRGQDLVTMCTLNVRERSR